MVVSRRKAAGLVVAIAVTAGLVTAAGASAEHREGKASVARVVGSAEFSLPYSKDDDVRSFSFDARAVPYSRPLPGIPTGLPTDAWGTVKVSHYFAENGTTVTADGKVDCLVTGPRTATLTAIITRVDAGGPDWVGKRIGFSVYDGGKDEGRSGDRVGFSWNGVNLLPDGEKEPKDAEVGTCMAPAPYAPVTKGGYTVRHVDLPLFPGQG
ncbi:hypothetical protein [Streptomyces sp. NBC_00239]|uniref:hypothetical protein n=1 Tax=Streptomyces sp. NBC_00239 TaxID=2903640 RepID=UPI002E293479|nr:hypothetical protein [Streptomyces sp. NBC_00239]